MLQETSFHLGNTHSKTSVCHCSLKTKTIICEIHLDSDAFALVPQADANRLIREVPEDLLELLEGHLGGDILASLGLGLLCSALLAAQVAHHLHHQPAAFYLPEQPHRFC